MISDVLHEAVRNMDEYLEEPTYASVYEGALRDRILTLRSEMVELVNYLDTPPDHTTPLRKVK